MNAKNLARLFLCVCLLLPLPALPQSSAPQSGGTPLTPAQLIKPADLNPQELTFYQTLDPAAASDFLVTRSYVRLYRQVQNKRQVAQRCNGTHGGNRKESRQSQSLLQRPQHRICRVTPLSGRINSGGRGVHEALAAASICSARGFEVGVVDMPSVHESFRMKLCASGELVLFAEQNNGYLWQIFLQTFYRNRESTHSATLQRVVTINTLNSQGEPQFIHSATYEQLMAAFGLTPDAIADVVENNIASRRR